MTSLVMFMFGMIVTANVVTAIDKNEPRYRQHKKYPNIYYDTKAKVLCHKYKGSLNCYNKKTNGKERR